MKKLLTLFAATAVLFAAMVMPASAAAEPVNVLGELGDPANITIWAEAECPDNEWFWWYPPASSATYSIVDAQKADGTTGKVVLSDHSSGSTTGTFRMWMSADKLQPETDYVFTAMVKVNDEVERASSGQGSWLQISGNGMDGKCASIGLSQAGQWIRQKFYFTTPAIENIAEAEPYHVRWAFEATPGKAWAYDFMICTKQEWDAWAAENEPEESEPSSTPSETPDENEDPDEDEESKEPVSINIQKPNSSKADANPSSDAEPKGLSTGAIVGIVAGAVVVLAGAAVAVYFLVIKKK